MADNKDKADKVDEVEEVHEVNPIPPEHTDPQALLAESIAKNAGPPIDFNKRISEATLQMEADARQADMLRDAAERQARVQLAEAEARRVQRVRLPEPEIPEGDQPMAQPVDTDDKLAEQKQPPDRTKMDDFAVESAKSTLQKEAEKEEKSKIPSAKRIEEESKPK